MGKREVTRSREELDLAVPQVSLERRAVDTERGLCDLGEPQPSLAASHPGFTPRETLCIPGSGCIRQQRLEGLQVYYSKVFISKSLEAPQQSGGCP